ncbi:MAG TPA: response regulator [Roseiflexaceae bacterium]|nr:response regulator [Roseiflexaceae bacterium]
MAKILLVEDDALNREMVTRRLTWEGYEVITAQDGAAAVALAEAEQPDLILMDLGLPILNGWQAAQRIKSSSRTQGIPIIALTAYALTEDREKSLEAGCDDYESKPIDFSRLQVKIQALLSGNTPSRA